MLGIFWINFVILGLPTGAYPVPSYIGDAVTANVSLWVFSELMVDGVMRGLFSALFGAGVLLYLSEQKIQDQGIKRVDYYYRRNILLMLIGIIHAYILLWPYDVLYSYGLMALFLFPLRNLPIKAMIVAGILLLILSDINFFNFDTESGKTDNTTTEQTAKPSKTKIDKTDIDEDVLKQTLSDKYHSSTTADFKDDIEFHQSSYLEIFKSKSKIAFEQHTTNMYSTSFFDVGGMMLLGMALLKLGILQGRRSRRFYFYLIIVGFITGIMLRIPAVYLEISNDFVPKNPLLPSMDNLNISRLPIMLGYIGLIMLLYKMNLFSRLFSYLAAVGKLALTNYVMQTVISIFLFYGFGFGLIGVFERYQLSLLCIFIWGLQITFSIQWLKTFKMGPLEWLWRSGVYLKWQPISRKSKVVACPQESG